MLTDYLTDYQVILQAQDAIIEAMYLHTNNPDGSDYQCAYCREYAPRNGELIQHRKDCQGQQVLDNIKKVYPEKKYEGR